jgi:hypothetical protein
MFQLATYPSGYAIRAWGFSAAAELSRPAKAAGDGSRGTTPRHGRFWGRSFHGEEVEEEINSLEDNILSTYTLLT